MPLAGKYLKYSPEITLEIFTLVWNKLLENGWKEYSNKTIEKSYSQLSGVYKKLIDTGSMCFNTHVNPFKKSQTETTVQEILGYDPFAKDKVIPEYVECIKIATQNTKIGEIFKCRHCNGSFEFEYNDKSGIWYNLWDSWSCVWGNEIPQKYFKPSTKEAFDAQNKPKSIEKWSIGSYAVALKNHVNWSKTEKGDIYLIKSQDVASNITKESDSLLFHVPKKPEEFKWFATKSEAEEFSKTLVKPVKHGNGILDAVDVKQQLKQAVHCKTQEEWDFVTEKLGYKWSNYSKWSSYKNNTCINLNELCFGTAVLAYRGYQILSFQEWCQQSEYKMEKEVKFEVGKYYRFNVFENKSSPTKTIRFAGINKDGDIICDLWLMNSETRFNIGENSWRKINVNNTIELSIEEIQQYLPANHVDKITPVIQQTRDMQSEFKVGEYVFWKNGNKVILLKDGTCKIANKRIEEFRHATQEEINNHLLSIGQIPVGEPLNTGIEPNKDGMFKYKQTMPGASWSGGTIDNHLDVMIQSKTQSEIEFNYLPEPK